MKNKKVTRREFIVTAGKTALAVAVAAPVIGFNASAGDKKNQPAQQAITLDLTKPENAALAAVGGALKIPNPLGKGKPIIVSRISEAEVAAFSSKCTHMGCEVPIPEKGLITCPCHGAQFDASGKVKKGPALKDLPSFTATLEGTTVTIKGNFKA
jgi:Rieske Fe-S protein